MNLLTFEEQTRTITVSGQPVTMRSWDGGKTWHAFTRIVTNEPMRVEKDPVRPTAYNSQSPQSTMPALSRKRPTIVANGTGGGYRAVYPRENHRSDIYVQRKEQQAAAAERAKHEFDQLRIAANQKQLEMPTDNTIWKHKSGKEGVRSMEKTEILCTATYSCDHGIHLAKDCQKCEDTFRLESY